MTEEVQHDPHECPHCPELAGDLITTLTHGERERLTEAFYKSKFGEQGYFGRPECEQMTEAVANAVLHIKVIAFHSGVRWKGQAHRLALELEEARAEIARLRGQSSERRRD